jgi:LysM repeat protein
MAQKLFQFVKSSTALLFFVLSVLTALTACQGNEETAVPLPTETKIAGTPIQVLIETQAPQVTETQALSAATSEPGQGETLSAETPLPPSPTLPPEPTPTATPPPEPTFYTVQPGDTLIGISEQFSISLDSLVFANGFTSAGEFALAVGDELQIPVCAAHRIL